MWAKQNMSMGPDPVSNFCYRLISERAHPCAVYHYVGMKNGSEKSLDGSVI